MKNILTIVKKEFTRFFKDRRMLLSIILPGLLIYVLYSLLGGIINDKTTVNASYKPTAVIVNAPENLNEQLDKVFVISKTIKTEEQAKQEISDEKLDVLIVFPENFDKILTGEIEAPADVKVYYNSASDNSYAGFGVASNLLAMLNKTLFTVNGQEGVYDLADDKAMGAKVLSTLVPMLIFALLASGCMAVAPEAIAGEKERGTMATMLITPIKRWQLALGKIISLTCFALLSGLSSFLGVILSLPKLTSGIIGADVASFYSVGSYFMLFGIIISVVLVIISAFSVISCFARSVKESSSLITPLMIVIILMGMAAMFFSSNPATGLYLIPLLGSGLAISGIMAFAVSPLAVILSIVSNLVVSILLIVLLSFMFRSERIMFKK